jgi:hypothetical protein
MGIRLDWQIEAERAYQRAGEDPGEKRRRRVQRLRILAFTAGVIIWLCIMAGIVWFRLYTVDNQIREALVNTVQAETATLRIGDFGGFLAIQWAAPGGTWIEEQSAHFKRYQDLKTKSDLKLTGNVLDAVVDGTRGRALVEEVIDGVPYRALWFYWRFGDGWRHVPADLTFWGDAQTINGKVSTVKFYQLDAPMSQALAPRIDRWWSEGCGYVGCQETPKLTVEIVAELVGQVRWDEKRLNTLIVPSPLAIEERIRADMPIPPVTEEAIAAQIASRVFDLATGNLRPVQTADAAWLRQMIVEWLSSTFVGRGDPDQMSFVQSLKDHYGPSALIALVQQIQGKADISVVGAALNQPLETLALDWRTFFQWRLNVEKTFLSRNDLVGFQALWDTANPQALEQMRQRQSRPAERTPQVQAVAISPGPDGAARATVQVAVDGKAQVIIFRLVDGAWKRSA